VCRRRRRRRREEEGVGGTGEGWEEEEEEEVDERAVIAAIQEAHACFQSDAVSESPSLLRTFGTWALVGLCKVPGVGPCPVSGLGL